MKTKAIFYHAGCRLCDEAEIQFKHALNPDEYEVERVNLKEKKERIPEAAEFGVKTVPAMVIGKHVFHTNNGADLFGLL